MIPPHLSSRGIEVKGESGGVDVRLNNDLAIGYGVLNRQCVGTIIWNITLEYQIATNVEVDPVNVEGSIAWAQASQGCGVVPACSGCVGYVID